MSERIEHWALDRLRPHPENATIFGDPEESNEFEAICKSIKADGIWEPLVVRSDGTVLSGHLRMAAARLLKFADVPVRVWSPFETYLDEVRFIIKTNTDRRHLSPQQIAFAVRRLKEIPRERGGAKAKRGGDRKSDAVKNQVASGSLLISKTRDEAAAQLGVRRNVADACETVFMTPGVPEPLKKAVNEGRVAPTTAAKAVRAETKRQGGELKATAALDDLAEHGARRRVEALDGRSDRDKRIAHEAEKYRTHYAALVAAYREVDGILTRMPLTSVLGPTEHQDYAQLIRDVALRAWREVEQAEGPTNAGRQMALAVIKGGRS